MSITVPYMPRCIPDLPVAPSTTPNFRPSYICKWEQDLGLQFTERQVERFLLLPCKISVYANHQETGYKVLTRWYYTPVRIHKMFPLSTDLCWRREEEPGSLLHIFWSCWLLLPYWTEIHRIVQKFKNQKLPKTPTFFLLHHHEIPSKIYRKSIQQWL